MRVLLLRHCVALKRQGWAGPDEERPLSPRGTGQAEELVAVLAAFEPAGVMSSPATRCLDSVAPLATKLGIPLEAVDELADGAPAASAADRVRLAASSSPLVVCSHGEVLPALMSELTGAPVSGKDDWPKGGTWVLEGTPPRLRATRYLPAPG